MYRSMAIKAPKKYLLRLCYFFQICNLKPNLNVINIIIKLESNPLNKVEK